MGIFSRRAPLERGFDSRLETAPQGLLSLGIVLLGLLAYWPVLRVPFMWDDPQMILFNPHLTPWTWANIKHTFTHDVFNQGIPYYRPLQTLLNMLDFSLYGFRPWGYHLTNLIIHLLNGLLLFRVLEELRFGRGSAFWVAGAFSVHPIIVQELMVVAGRAELLSSFFVLLGLWGWMRETRSGWGLSLVCFPLAILSKESGASLPFLLASTTLFRSSLKERWRSLFPHFILLILYLFLRSHFIGEMAPRTGAREGTLFALLQAPKIMFVYVRLLLIPWHQHSHRYQPPPGWDSLILWGVALAGIGWAVSDPDRWKKTLFWAGWFFSFLVPKIPLLATNALMLEHWVYLAGVGVYGPILIALGKGRRPGAALLPIIFWMGATLCNLHLRGSDALNYAYSARFSSSPWLRQNWARDLMINSQPAEAATLYEEILGRHPENFEARNGLAIANLNMGQTVKAISLLEENQRLRPSDATPWIQLATVYHKMGDIPKALDCTEKALVLDPRSADALFGKAECLRAMSRWNEAIAAYRAALLVHPTLLEARNNLAGLLAQSGDLNGATEELRFIVRTNPDYPHVQENLLRLNRRRDNPPLKRG